jgi:hypothetical protein
MGNPPPHCCSSHYHKPVPNTQTYLDPPTQTPSTASLHQSLAPPPQGPSSSLHSSHFSPSPSYAPPLPIAATLRGPPQDCARYSDDSPSTVVSLQSDHSTSSSDSVQPAALRRGLGPRDQPECLARVAGSARSLRPQRIDRRVQIRVTDLQLMQIPEQTGS